MSDLAKQLVISLFAAHVVGEFILQSEEDVARKANIRVLLIHSAKVALLSYLSIGLWKTWEIPVVIFLFHSIIDFIKGKMSRKDLNVLSIDQLAHISVIFAISVVITSIDRVSWVPFWETQFGSAYYHLLVITSGVIVTVFAGAIIVGFAVEPFLDQLKSTVQSFSASGGKLNSISSRGFENGGKVIGQLERALIFVLVLVDQPTAIGFLIAAKSIFRFGEIRERANRMEAEYIIIGTFMSFLFGMIMSYLTRYVLDFI